MQGDDQPDLNTAQQEILDRLGATRSERPTFDPSLAQHLQHELESRLTPIAQRLAARDEDLWLSKHQLETIHGCEVRFLHERDAPFEWSPPKARGAVAHKAIELAVVRKDEPTPLELVDDAMGSLMEDTGNLGKWLATCGEVARAQVASEANTRVAAFAETWPPLSKKWFPVLEGRMRAELFDGTVILAGTPDLTVGRADGQTAGKVIVDFKTGLANVSHIADLRFYALLDTLRLGVPPRLLATSYLDSGRLFTEEVTEQQLLSTVDRVVDAAGLIITLLDEERDPELRPGPVCRWCDLRESCDEGHAFLADAGLDEIDPIG